MRPVGKRQAKWVKMGGVIRNPPLISGQCPNKWAPPPPRPPKDGSNKCTTGKGKHNALISGHPPGPKKMVPVSRHAARLLGRGVYDFMSNVMGKNEFNFFTIKIGFRPKIRSNQKQI